MRTVSVLGLGVFFAAFATEPAFGDDIPPGERALDRLHLRNFSEMEELSMEELLGHQGLRFALDYFGDVGFAATFGQDSEDMAFEVGQLGVMMTADLGRSIRGLAEFVIEADEENRPVADPERLALRWASGRFFVMAGRMHSELGYWNSAYQHGSWLQIPINRPRVVSFEDEGGLAPVHSVGVDAGVTLRLGETSLRIVGGIANGRGDVVDDVRMVNDTNDAKALRLTVRWSELGWKELSVGAGVVHDQIAAAPVTIRPALPDVGLDELVGNVYGVWAGESLTVISEGYVFVHRGGGDSWTTLAAFATVGYQFRRIEPYAQVEILELVGGASPFFAPDPAIADADLLHGSIMPSVGVRYELSPWSSVKAEYHLERFWDGHRVDHTFGVSWGFGI